MLRDRGEERPSRRLRLHTSIPVSRSCPTKIAGHHSPAESLAANHRLAQPTRSPLGQERKRRLVHPSPPASFGPEGPAIMQDTQPTPLQARALDLIRSFPVFIVIFAGYA